MRAPAHWHWHSSDTRPGRAQSPSHWHRDIRSRLGVGPEFKLKLGTQAHWQTAAQADSDQDSEAGHRVAQAQAKARWPRLRASLAGCHWQFTSGLAGRLFRFKLARFTWQPRREAQAECDCGLRE